MNKLATFATMLVFGASVSAETSLPEGVTSYIKLESISPVPRTCHPRQADVNFFVLAPTGILTVFTSNGATDFDGYFDLTGMFLVDTDGTGKPEAYGFGTVRSEAGGGYPSYLWINRDGEKIDFREEKYYEEFHQGLLLDEQYQGSGLPTLVIALSEWSCSILARPNGDVAAN